MKAAIYTRYGPPDVVHLADIPTPTPAQGQVLVKIVTTTVSAADWRLRAMDLPKGMGLFGRLAFGITGPRKQILGTEYSGVIAAIGPGVTRWQVGDAVIGFPGGTLGAHAEFIVTPADGSLVKKPDALSFETAAALPFGAVTAYDFLVNKAHLAAGEKVLINGASGATGSAAVQIAAHLGAEVTAVASAANEALVKGLGAARVIDYKTTDFTDDPARYDMIVDTVGTAPWSRARHALAPNGRFVMISASLSDMIFADMRARRSGHRVVGGVASEAGEILQTIVDWTAKGSYTPVIDRIYAFEDIVEAHRLVDSKRKRGAVVVRVSQT